MTRVCEGRFETLARQARELRNLDARRRAAKLKAPPLTPEEFDRRVEELLAQVDELAPPEEQEAARQAAGMTGKEASTPGKQIRPIETRRARPTAVDQNRVRPPEGKPRDHHANEACRSRRRGRLSSPEHDHHAEDEDRRD